jgi:hypothetical protein
VAINNVLEARVVISPGRDKVIINPARDNQARKARPDKVNTVLITGHNGRVRVDLSSVPVARVAINNAPADKAVINRDPVARVAINRVPADRVVISNDPVDKAVINRDLEARAAINRVPVKDRNGQARDRIGPDFLVTAHPDRVNTGREQALE